MKRKIVVVLLAISILTSMTIEAGAISGSGEEDATAFAARLEKDRVILTVPPAELDKDFLVVRAGIGQKLVRWVREGDKILLIAPIVEKSIGRDAHVGVKLRNDLFDAWRPSILATFPIRTQSKKIGYEIDVTDLFLKRIEGLPSIEGVIDYDKCRVNKVFSYKGLVEIRATMTRSAAGLIKYDRDRYEEEPLTISAFWSFLKLPETHMRPRLYDTRMGFFSDAWDLRSPVSPAGIARWRLEKKDSGQSLSEPKKPIVFYFAENTPAWMKPWLKAGIESWRKGFEAAGFKDAVIVRDTPDNGAEFDGRSMRYSVVKVRNREHFWRYRDPHDEASGGGTVDVVIDPRSGEILKADIIVTAPHELMQNLYFALCGVLDSRARRAPFPESLEGAFLQNTAAHESGHAFGIIDGNYGEFVYPTEKLRDKEWLSRMGFTPSVMNYSRCNYVAQPQDKIPAEYLLPRVGPADIHMIKWAYTQFIEADSWQDESPFLEAIIKEMKAKPWYTYIEGRRSNIPQRYHNAVDSDDPVMATKLGLNNLKNAINRLPEATLHEGGGQFLLEQMYFDATGYWVTLMSHVATLVGGYTIAPKSATEPGPVHTPIPAERQREAMAYLGEAAFHTPAYLINPAISNRFEPPLGSVDHVVGLQSRVLKGLVRYERLKALVEFELSAPANVDIYSQEEFLTDVRHAIWSELGDENAEITAYRQQLQKEYLAVLDQLFKFRTGDKSYAVVAFAIHSDLKSLRHDLDRALQQARDRKRRDYLEYVLAELDLILAAKR
ncbi:zinc-dependent metalloprotease [Hyphococcus luteus]|uniref:DUF5117 domain-containing protein n=1 Tax=Hyphococcus luteus TaxID=2058213 RepID=A0A2S7K9T6_9PROT|nr:zinc-dependent metalloprotease [Marinicaulis flavus]PQA89209.1 hypothetical protein CW354_04525 [Marinicaulis flavus]